MAYRKSVICVVAMSNSLSIEELPLKNRSDKWWDEFWRRMGLKEARRVSEKL